MDVPAIETARGGAGLTDVGFANIASRRDAKFPGFIGYRHSARLNNTLTSRSAPSIPEGRNVGRTPDGI